MTATNIFFSTNSPQADRPYTANNSNTSGSLNMGNASDATDYLELRVMVYTTGTTKTNVTKRDINNFLRLCERWLEDHYQGLDYVLSANSIAAPIP